MVKLANLFSCLKSKRCLVAGDLMLDRYTFGSSKRISPEAPVPVVLVESEDDRAGGAGNVALGLQSLGQKVRILGRVGEDDAGIKVKNTLSKHGIELDGLFCEKAYPTTHKSRIIAGNQQVVRIDHEKNLSLSSALETQIIAKIPELLKDCDVVAISDYGKGFLTEPLLKALILEAKKLNIPVIADPKGSNFKKYNYVTVLKPNLSEAITASKLQDAPLSLVAKKIFEEVSVDVLMITRSEAGISLYYQDESSEDYPVREAKEVRDVTGAGDTVLAMLAAGMGNGLKLSESTELANIAATIAVERVGCVQVTLAEVAKRLIALDANGKVFTEEHAETLIHALEGNLFTLLELDESYDISAELIRAIQKVHNESALELIVSLKKAPSNELIVLLSSLKEVDYIFVGDYKEALFAATIQPSQRVLYSEVVQTV